MAKPRLKPKRIPKHISGKLCKRLAARPLFAVIQTHGGFTLIELLVVVFIISIVTGLALLSINHNENRKLEATARELTQAISLAEEQAMLEPMVLGLTLKPHSYQFSSYQPTIVDSESKALWLPLADRLLNGRPIARDIQFAVEVGGNRAFDDEEGKGVAGPQIVISTNGDITPFKIYISKTGGSPRYVVSGDEGGNISMQSVS